MKRSHSRPTYLRQRLIVGTGAMLLPLVTLGAGTLVCFENAIATFAKTENETLEELFPLTDLESLIVKASVPALDYLSHGDIRERERFVRLSREVDNTFASVLAKSLDLPEKQALVRASQLSWQQAQKSSEAILSYSYPVENAIAAPEKKRLETHTQEAVHILDQLYKLLTHLQLADNLAQATSIQQKFRLIIIMVFGLGLAVAVVAAVVLARSILLPLRILEEGVNQLGEGNLSYRISVFTQDELGQLARTFNLMAEKLEQSQVALKNLATRDGLTGVYNRREFNLRLIAELTRSRRYGHTCSLMMLDIDYFKKLNDTHGHQAGDEALRVVASLIEQEVRPVDQVARYGGEEFAVILPETSGLNASAAAERLRNAIATHAIPITQEQTINVTVSVGLATFPSDAGSEETLIAAADQALYAAKHSGRNRVVSSSSLSLSS